MNGHTKYGTFKQWITHKNKELTTWVAVFENMLSERSLSQKNVGSRERPERMCLVDKGMLSRTPMPSPSLCAENVPAAVSHSLRLPPYQDLYPD